MGLDWGGGPNCDGGLASNPPCPLFPLISTWLLSAYDAIQSSGVAVELYFDSTLNGFFPQLDVACAPNSPTRSSCSPTQIALQHLPWPAEGGPPFPPFNASNGDPIGRFRIPNDEWGSLQGDCAGGSASWWQSQNTDERAGSTMPYLWYEQQAQADFLTLIDNWIECGKAGGLPPETVNVNTGMVAVSNVNPAMYEVFVSSRTNRGLNVQFTNSTSESTARATPPTFSDLHFPFVLTLPAAQSGVPPEIDRCVFLATTPASPVDSPTTIYSLSSVDGQAPSPLSSSSSSSSSTFTLPFSGPLASFSFFAGQRPRPLSF